MAPFHLRITSPPWLPFACTSPKEVDGFTSVVYNLHYLPARLLREWARSAGAHIYAEDDNSVWATRGLLLIHTACDARHRIHLPTRTDVLDLRSGKTRQRNVDRFHIDAAAGRTFFYSIGR